MQHCRWKVGSTILLGSLLKIHHSFIHYNIRLEENYHMLNCSFSVNEITIQRNKSDQPQDVPAKIDHVLDSKPRPYQPVTGTRFQSLRQLLTGGQVY